MAKPTKTKNGRVAKGGCCKTLGMIVVLVAVGMAFLPGNPTQQLGRLFNVAVKGIPGGEDALAFDAVYADTTGKGNVQQNKADDKDVANAYYNLATEFYEYGWGDSFHFGWRKKGEAHSSSIANSQTFVAQKLRVGDMDRVLDLGCGIGGPLRGVVRRTGANVTGLTINAHQVKRAYEITSALPKYMQDRCHYMVNDYLDMKGLEENTYDAAFYMESSLHCLNRTQTFSETFRHLKPGGRLVAMEYVTLPGWDPENPEHAELMQKHLAGNGAAKTPTIEEDLEMMRKAGFVVEEHFDFMAWGQKIHGDDEFPWWGDLQAGVPTANWIPALLPAHPYVRRPLPHLLRLLAKIGLVPEDVPRAADLMNVGGDGLSGLGRVGALTPQYYVLGVKPL